MSWAAALSAAAGGFTGSTLHADSAANTSDVFGNRYVGGIVSVNGSGGVIQTSTNSGLVAGLGKNAAYVGGIVGVNDATWGAGSAVQTEEAQLINCTNSMSGDNATDSRRIRLLQALSTTRASPSMPTMWAAWWAITAPRAA